MQYVANAKQFQSRNVEVVVSKTTYGRMWSVYLSCTSAYSKESRLMLTTCEGHFSASLLIGGQTDVATIAPALMCTIDLQLQDC